MFLNSLNCVLVFHDNKSWSFIKWYTFKYVLFFISLIAFICPIVKLSRCFLFPSFNNILLTPCRNLLFQSTHHSAALPHKFLLSGWCPCMVVVCCMLEQVLGLSLKVVFCFHPVLSQLDLWLLLWLFSL